MLYDTPGISWLTLTLTEYIYSSIWHYRVFSLISIHPLQKIKCGCACQMSKFWLLLYLFLYPSTINQYTNFVQKTTNFAQIGAFYNNLLNFPPPPNRYTKSGNKTPQKTGTYTMSMWESPPGSTSIETLYGEVPPKWVGFWQKNP